MPCTSTTFSTGWWVTWRPPRRRQHCGPSTKPSHCVDPRNELERTSRRMAEDRFSLRDKVAVITGAGSGIGNAIASSLAKRGTHVVAVDINADRLATIVEELAAHGVGGLPFNIDISRPDAFGEILDATLERFGHVDIVVNNVGVFSNGLPQDT